MAAVGSLLDRYRSAELTLEELVIASANLLKRLGFRPDDGRVSQAPDPRGVRYYQGIGVLDRPLRYDGRRAMYGFRHLLQLLAVKRLQQEGHPLHLIQQSLAGRPTAALEHALATVLSDLDPTSEPEVPTASPVLPGLRPPTPAAAPPGLEAAREPISAPVTQSAPAPFGQPPEPAPRPAPLIAARVAPGVTITIDPALVSDPHAVIARVGHILTHMDKEH